VAAATSEISAASTAKREWMGSRILNLFISRRCRPWRLSCKRDRYFHQIFHRSMRPRRFRTPLVLQASGISLATLHRFAMHLAARHVASLLPCHPTKRFQDLKATAVQCFSSLRKRANYSVRFFLAEFLESGIGAQRIPERIEPEKGRGNGCCAVNEGSTGRL
jgi:hypothetical protein